MSCFFSLLSDVLCLYWWGTRQRGVLAGIDTGEANAVPCRDVNLSKHFNFDAAVVSFPDPRNTKRGCGAGMCPRSNNILSRPSCKLLHEFPPTVEVHGTCTITRHPAVVGCLHIINHPGLSTQYLLPSQISPYYVCTPTLDSADFYTSEKSFTRPGLDDHEHGCSFKSAVPGVFWQRNLRGPYQSSCRWTLELTFIPIHSRVHAGVFSLTFPAQGPGSCRGCDGNSRNI